MTHAIVDAAKAIHVPHCDQSFRNGPIIAAQKNIIDAPNIHPQINVFKGQYSF